MNLNVLKPGKAVEQAFEKPNVPLALVLVLLPALASIAGSFAFGTAPKIEAMAYSVIMAFLTFFVLTVVVFLLGFLVNPKAAKGKGSGLLSALALAQILSLFVILVSFAAIPLVVAPQAMEMLAEAGSSPSPEIRAVQINSFLTQNPTAINLPALAVFLAVAFAAFILGLYIIYLAVKRFTESRKLVALALMLISMLILGFLPL